MSEIRQDQATKRWVIMATERAKRPRDLIEKKLSGSSQPEHSPTCPFCPGNEQMTPPELFAIRENGGPANSPGWQVRVLPNRFAALRPEGEVMITDPLWFTTITGVGAHEVVIESPRHNATPAALSVDEVAKVLLALGEREKALEEDRRLSYIAFFRNQGLAGGSSLAHPHTQIIATPIAPVNIRLEIEEARRHYDDRLSCVYCETVEKEREAGKRVVLETEEFFVFEPFASRWPFETWIISKQHSSIVRLAETGPDRFRALARVLQQTLGALYHSLDDPAYNLVVHQAPTRDRCEDYYHWHIEILPRLSTEAGFELGTGIWINSSLPEDSAAYLRDFV
ncbi:MAG: galactose-1-phosphate uridylyltransferase [Armatimonadota bacterium]|jgi:UDPglucose--hexose-1-phosphate uridylyltransferase